MRVLVTGATGFLGRHIVAALLRRGHTVRAVVRPGTPADLPTEVECARLDLRHPDGIAAALDGIDLVIHAAAVMRGTRDEQMTGTVVPTQHLLSAMLQAGVRRFLLVSSFAVYRGEPGPAGHRHDEDSATGTSATARDAYAEAKLLQERVIVETATASGWSATLARPGVVFGPGHLWTNRLGYRLGSQVWVGFGHRAALPLTYVVNAGDAIAHLAEFTVAGAEETGGASNAVVRTVDVIDGDLPSQQTYRRHLEDRLGGPRLSIVVPFPVIHAVARLLAVLDRLLGGRLPIPGALRLETVLLRWRPTTYSDRVLRATGWVPPVSWAEAFDASMDPDALPTIVDGPTGGTTHPVGRNAAGAPLEAADRPTHSTAPVASVIVPAYNEEATIERCLRSLLNGAEPGEFDVIVVCNACTDGTAAIARTVSDDVRVLETPVPSKTRAMNLGDDAARTFPRVYVDADVELRVDALRAVIAPLVAGEVEASAPGMRFDTTGSTWWVRAYHRVWSALPQVSSGLGGRGVYALSEEGHARFGRFPDIIADDLFVDWTFPPDRRAVVDARSVVRAEADLAQLIHRKSRIYAGRSELLERGDRPGADAGLRSLVRATLAHPWLLPKVPVFVLATLEAKRRGRRRSAEGGSPSWEPLR